MGTVCRVCSKGFRTAFLGFLMGSNEGTKLVSHYAQDFSSLGSGVIGGFECMRLTNGID